MGSNAQIAKNFDRLTIGGTSLIGGQAPVPPGQTGFSSLVSPSGKIKLQYMFLYCLVFSYFSAISRRC